MILGHVSSKLPLTIEWEQRSTPRAGLVGILLSSSREQRQSAVSKGSCASVRVVLHWQGNRVVAEYTVSV